MAVWRFGSENQKLPSRPDVRRAYAYFAADYADSEIQVTSTVILSVFLCVLLWLNPALSHTYPAQTTRRIRLRERYDRRLFLLQAPVPRPILHAAMRRLCSTIHRRCATGRWRARLLLWRH